MADLRVNKVTEIIWVEIMRFHHECDGGIGRKPSLGSQFGITVQFFLSHLHTNNGFFIAHHLIQHFYVLKSLLENP